MNHNLERIIKEHKDSSVEYLTRYIVQKLKPLIHAKQLGNYTFYVTKHEMLYYRLSTSFEQPWDLDTNFTVLSNCIREVWNA